MSIRRLVQFVLALSVLWSLASLGAGTYDYYGGNWPKGLLERVHRYHLEQGYEHLRRGNHRGALNDAEFILNRFPNDPQALQLAMKIALQRPERQSASMSYFELALQQYPEHGETWLLHGIYLHRLGRTEEAVESYRKAIARNARPAESHYNLGLALVELGHFREANAAAQRAYELEHPLPGLRERLKANDAWAPDGAAAVGQEGDGS